MPRVPQSSTDDDRCFVAAKLRWRPTVHNSTPFHDRTLDASPRADAGFGRESGFAFPEIIMFRRVSAARLFAD